MNPPQDKNQEVCNKGIMKENHKVIKCDCKDTEDNLKKEIKQEIKELNKEIKSLREDRKELRNEQIGYKKRIYRLKEELQRLK